MKNFFIKILSVFGLVLGASSALAVAIPVVLNTDAATLSRTGIVSASVDFLATDVAQGITSKDISLVSLAAVSRCVFTWSHQMQRGDLVPRNVSLSEENVSCEIDQQQGRILLTPRYNVTPVTIEIGPEVFQGRGADRLLYSLQPFEVSGTGWDYNPTLQQVAKSPTNIIATHLVLTRGEVTYQFGARWFNLGRTVATDPMQSFSGDGFVVQ